MCVYCPTEYKHHQHEGFGQPPVLAQPEAPAKTIQEAFAEAQASNNTGDQAQ